MSGNVGRTVQDFSTFTYFSRCHFVANFTLYTNGALFFDRSFAFTKTFVQDKTVNLRAFSDENNITKVRLAGVNTLQRFKE
jgi:hypothetical protein